ncbi:MAG: 16S rRNA (cytidine(1402)-2'-O)-methyltransferase [Pseudomonadota bacterium]
MLDLKPGLYVTATPIGNLGDITYRAVDILKNADLILCEDTRQTAKLCAAYGVKTPRRAYHDHNGAQVRPEILDRLSGGERICLVSDAGTPLIADPGYKLVSEARDRGVSVFPVPGPSALTAALSAAGAPTDRFVFAGFPPQKSAGRKTYFKTFKTAPGSLVFYESGPRLAASLADMAAVYGGRKATVARELTKLHEEFVTNNLEDLAGDYRENPPKGEIVIIVFPLAETEADADTLDAFLQERLAAMGVKEAATEAAAALGVARRDAYSRALQLKERM